LKRAQVVKFWKSLDECTSRKEIITAFANKVGYGGERTLDRYIRAYDGFRLGETLAEIANKTGWKPKNVEKLKSWWSREFTEPVASTSRGVESGDEELHEQTTQESKAEGYNTGIDTEAIKFDKRVFIRSDNIVNERDLRNLLLGLELHRRYKLSEYLKMARYWEFMGLESNKYQHSLIQRNQNRIVSNLDELLIFLKLEFREEDKSKKGKEVECQLEPAGMWYLHNEADQVRKMTQAQDDLDKLLQSVRESFRAYRGSIRNVLYL